MRCLALAVALMSGCAAPREQPVAPAAPDAPRTELSALSQSTVTLLVLSEGLWGQATRTREGSGSGFVIEDDGVPLVVTAAHVVRGATEIAVIDAEGRRAHARELLAFDEEADVAVLRVPDLAPSIRPIPIGPQPEVGQEVMLVSSPLGLSTTVAFGTMSAQRPEMRALQLAAGVSPGSSGGLVADRKGRAVAVIRSKAPAELGGENIALATPIAFAVDELAEDVAIPLSPRPDGSRMEPIARHELLSMRAAENPVYGGQTSVVVPVGERPLEHVCAQTSDAEAALAIREVGRDDAAGWREGVGRTCATVWGGQPIEVWVGTKSAGRRVQLTVSRQK